MTAVTDCALTSQNFIIMRDDVVDDFGNLDHLGFLNVCLIQSTRVQAFSPPPKRRPPLPGFISATWRSAVECLNLWTTVASIILHPKTVQIVIMKPVARPKPGFRRCKAPDYALRLLLMLANMAV